MNESEDRLPQLRNNTTYEHDSTNKYTSNVDESMRLKTEAERQQILLPKKNRKKRLQTGTSRLAYTSLNMESPKKILTTTNRDALERYRIKQRSSSRKNRFESKLEKLAADRSLDVINTGLNTYKSEIDYLRRQLQSKEKDILTLQKSTKLIKNQQLEVERELSQVQLSECKKELIMYQGMMQGARDIIGQSKERLSAQKKSLLRRLREENMELEGDLFYVRAQLQKVQTKLNLSEKDKFIFQRRMHQYKLELENAQAERNIVNRTRRETHSEATRELSTVKKKTAELEAHIDKLREQNYILQKEIGTLKNEMVFKQSQFEALEKRNQQLVSEKATIETSLIARMHDMQNNRRQIERQMSSVIYQVKVKERKRMVSKEEIAPICKKLVFRLVRQGIEHKNIANMVDPSKFKDNFHPTDKELEIMLGSPPFNLAYDQQLLFAKYLLENDSPLHDDSDEETRTNSTPMVRAILEKAIDKYELINRATQQHLMDTLAQLFHTNRSLIDTIRRNMSTYQLEYLDVNDLKKYCREFFIDVSEQLYFYIQMRSFELTENVYGINITRVKGYIQQQYPHLQK